MEIDFSDRGIVNDDMAATFFNPECQPPCLSDVFKAISNKLDKFNVKTITTLNMSKNNFNPNTILQYCYDNKDGFFSIDDFKHLDLSYTIIFKSNHEDIKKCINLVCELLNKYSKLIINLSYTELDCESWLDKCIEQNPYKDMDLYSRLILQQRTKCEDRKREEERIEQRMREREYSCCIHCKCNCYYHNDKSRYYRYY